MRRPPPSMSLNRARSSHPTRATSTRGRSRPRASRGCATGGSTASSCSDPPTSCRCEGWRCPQRRRDRPPPEHAIEVQLPFLLRVLGRGWTCLPVAVGVTPPDAVADLLVRLQDQSDLV